MDYVFASLNRGVLAFGCTGGNKVKWDFMPYSCNWEKYVLEITSLNVVRNYKPHFLIFFLYFLENDSHR